VIAPRALPAVLAYATTFTPFAERYIDVATTEIGREKRR
jgi:hypothetical protein